MTFMRAIENAKNEEKTVDIITVGGHTFTGKVTRVDLEIVIVNDSNGVAIVSLNHIVAVQNVVHTPGVYKKPVGRPAKVMTWRGK